ncbi:MAG: hypothetical protein OES14_03455 [Nitrosopumilus sp.]|nr:hypothetical protein [Nitrosopumilus sp.]MDH3824827.1 hypothetical protein [Nitrosopumilus sp.]
MKIDESSQCKEDLKIPLTNEGLRILCHRICDEPKIRFCSVINSLGRIVTGGFSKGIKPLDSEDLRQMLYIQSTLELSMKGEFDDTLGNVNFITTYRDNTAIITIPMTQNYLLLMSVERNAQIEQIVKKTISLFESNGILDRKSKSTSLGDNPNYFLNVH